MIPSQVKLVLRPNNQVTISLGNWRKPISLAYAPESAFNSLVTPERLAKEKARIAAASEKFRERESFRYKPSGLNLDIIREKQPLKKSVFARKNTPKNFTAKSGQRLRECGAAMDILADGDLSQCYEICLTLPADHETAFSAIAEHTYYATNLLFSKLKKDFFGSVSWFYVWEYQRRGALHLHIAVHHPNPEMLPGICESIKAHWIQILLAIGERENICMFSRKDLKSCTISQKWQMHSAQIQKAVGAYFSKYAGKTQSKQDFFCQKYPISRFWGSSRSLKEIIKKNSIEILWDFCGYSDQAQEKCEEIIKFVCSELNVFSQKSYEFKVESKGNVAVFRDKDGKIHTKKREPKIYAEGERFIFYISPEKLQFALEIFRNESKFF
jgi:hypothetical protein